MGAMTTGSCIMHWYCKRTLLTARLGTGSFVQANYGAFSSAIAAMRAALPLGAQNLVEMHAGELRCSGIAFRRAAQCFDVRLR
jgi:hypothetical protein